MTLSLIGIICIQGYWIGKAFQSNKEQFVFNVKQAMATTSKRIGDREFLRYFTPLKKAIKELQEKEDKNAISLLKTFNLESEKDSLVIYKKRSNKQIKSVLDSIAGTLSKNYSDWKKQIEFQNDIGNLSDNGGHEFLLYEKLIHDFANTNPIIQRVNPDQVQYLLKNELKKRDINIDFEFAIFENKKQSTVASEKFLFTSGSIFSTPIFTDDEGKSNISLWVNFNNKKLYVWSKIGIMVLLSTLLVLVILSTYFFAFRQIKKQREISQIKTDFINNMTHELKTPIASINLALDFMNNPKVMDNAEMRERYLGIIRTENDRIHKQVDTVIRISRLGKKEINLNKESINLNTIIEREVTKQTTNIEKPEGYIKMHLNADRDTIFGNEEHISNAVMSILDNAIKYVEDNTPKIDVYTENSQNSIILKVADKGIGIDKKLQHKIFDKFFRIPTGDIHNVKGYGLGLSYAKYIVEDHQGEISVESDKGKGTIFTIKLPLTT